MSYPPRRACDARRSRDCSYAVTQSHPVTSPSSTLRIAARLLDRRMQSVPDIGEFVPRAYQNEIFEKARDGNIICAMETGSGKVWRHSAKKRVFSSLPCALDLYCSASREIAHCKLSKQWEKSSFASGSIMTQLGSFSDSRLR